MKSAFLALTLLATIAFAEDDADAPAVTTTKSIELGYPTIHLVGLGEFDGFAKQFGFELGAT